MRPARFDGAALSGFRLGAPGDRLLLRLALVVNALAFAAPLLLRRVFRDEAFAARPSMADR
ncbi:MAG: hypothetical protein AAF371_13140 [Pseudomonadota bacterium]